MIIDFNRVCYFFSASKKYRKKDAALRKLATDSSLKFNTFAQLARGSNRAAYFHSARISNASLSNARILGNETNRLVEDL
jgi:hypothetical protein